MCVMFQDSAIFEEVAVDFPEEEWPPLDPDQKILRRDMMLGNYRSLASVSLISSFIGYHFHKPNLLTHKELRTKKRRVLIVQETHSDQKFQLKAKETTAKQNKLWEKLLSGKGHQLNLERFPMNVVYVEKPQKEF
ncbi:zinc finger protein 177-like [Panthera onca]